jgi:hypothetical protein
MFLLKRLAVMAFMPVWVAGVLVCLVLTVTGIGWVLTGDYAGLFEWWIYDVLNAVCNWGA